MKYLLSTILITLGILLSFKIDNAEIPFYKSLVHNWSISLLATHLVPGVSILFSLIIVFAKKIKKTLYLNVILSIFLLIEWGFSNIYDHKLLELILINLSIILSIIIISEKIQTSTFVLIKNKIPRLIVIIISSIISVIIPFLISPIPQYALIDHPTENITSNYVELLNNQINLDSISNKTTVIALFSTNCPFCFEAAEKIGITQKLKNFKNVITIFPSKKEDADLFIQNAKYKTSKVLCKKEDFLKLTDGRYPKFYVIDVNQKVSRYGASSFQQRTIDLLSKSN
jgi:thiol-disulfide isomerase/thioredoxin